MSRRRYKRQVLGVERRHRHSVQRGDNIPIDAAADEQIAIRTNPQQRRASGEDPLRLRPLLGQLQVDAEVIRRTDQIRPQHLPSSSGVAQRRPGVEHAFGGNIRFVRSERGNNCGAEQTDSGAVLRHPRAERPDDGGGEQDVAAKYTLDFEAADAASLYKRLQRRFEFLVGVDKRLLQLCFEFVAHFVHCLHPGGSGRRRRQGRQGLDQCRRRHHQDRHQSMRLRRGGGERRERQTRPNHRSATRRHS